MLAIAGGKGGVGKTTAALGLGQAFARSGRDPVVVDADVDMPDLHLLAGADREPTADRLADGAPVERAVQRPPELPGVGVVPAGSPEAVPEALRRLERWGGPVLVDCPAGASRDATRPLRSCDRAVLVTTDATEALEDTAKTAAVAQVVGAPPAVTAVRGDSPRRAEPWFECPVVRVPTVVDGAAHAHPRFRAACRRIAKISTRDGGRIFNPR